MACVILLGTSMASVADSIKSKTLLTIADAKTSPAVALDLGEPGDTIGD
jgi:hypothetical protein